MPVIFASTIISLPTVLTYFVKNASVLSFINKVFTTETPVGFTIYMLLIILFTYIYTFMVLSPDKMSKDLNKAGGYIPGIRPGTETKTYISKVLSRITFLGAIFIAVIAALPIVFSATTSLPSSVRIGGTSILIVVGVVLETYKQLESSLASRSYNKR